MLTLSYLPDKAMENLSAGCSEQFTVTGTEKGDGTISLYIYGPDIGGGYPLLSSIEYDQSKIKHCNEDELENRSGIFDRLLGKHQYELRKRVVITCDRVDDEALDKVSFILRTDFGIKEVTVDNYPIYKSYQQFAYDVRRGKEDTSVECFVPDNQKTAFEAAVKSSQSANIYIECGEWGVCSDPQNQLNACKAQVGHGYVKRYDSDSDRLGTTVMVKDTWTVRNVAGNTGIRSCQKNGIEVGTISCSQYACGLGNQVMRINCYNNFGK